MLPPTGTPTVRVADDLVALIVFSLVAFAVGGLVASRVDALARIEQQRATLLRLVSHDLRTPLAAVVGAARGLRRDWLDDAGRRDLLDMVVEEGMRLDRLVANLLSLARIEAGALQPRWQAVDLHEVVEQSTRRLEAVRRGRRGAGGGVEPELPLVQGDHGLLEQVVANLVENAIRHRRRAAGHGAGRGGPRAGAASAWRKRSPACPRPSAATIFEPFRRGGGPPGWPESASPSARRWSRPTAVASPSVTVPQAEQSSRSRSPFADVPVLLVEDDEVLAHAVAGALRGAGLPGRDRGHGRRGAGAGVGHRAEGRGARPRPAGHRRDRRAAGCGAGSPSRSWC